MKQNQQSKITEERKKTENEDEPVKKNWWSKINGEGKTSRRNRGRQARRLSRSKKTRTRSGGRSRRSRESESVHGLARRKIKKRVGASSRVEERGGRWWRAAAERNKSCISLHLEYLPHGRTFSSLHIPLYSRGRKTLGETFERDFFHIVLACVSSSSRWRLLDDWR